MTFEATAEIMHLCDLARPTGFDLRKYDGNGHLERVYENGLALRQEYLGAVHAYRCRAK